MVGVCVGSVVAVRVGVKFGSGVLVSFIVGTGGIVSVGRANAVCKMDDSAVASRTSIGYPSAWGEHADAVARATIKIKMDTHLVLFIHLIIKNTAVRINCLDV